MHAIARSFPRLFRAGATFGRVTWGRPDWSKANGIGRCPGRIVLRMNWSYQGQVALAGRGKEEPHTCF
jgi:hypothetical protein